MAGGAHIFDMIKRLRENDNLRKKTYFRRYKGVSSSCTQTMNDIEATEKERINIRQEAIMADREERRKAVINLVLAGVIGLLLILLFFLLKPLF